MCADHRSMLRLKSSVRCVRRSYAFLESYVNLPRVDGHRTLHLCGGFETAVRCAYPYAILGTQSVLPLTDGVDRQRDDGLHMAGSVLRIRIMLNQHDSDCGTFFLHRSKKVWSDKCRQSDSLLPSQQPGGDALTPPRRPGGYVHCLILELRRCRAHVNIGRLRFLPSPLVDRSTEATQDGTDDLSIDFSLHDPCSIKIVEGIYHGGSLDARLRHYRRRTHPDMDRSLTSVNGLDDLTSQIPLITDLRTGAIRTTRLSSTLVLTTLRDLSTLWVLIIAHRIVTPIK